MNVRYEERTLAELKADEGLTSFLSKHLINAGSSDMRDVLTNRRLHRLTGAVFLAYCNENVVGWSMTYGIHNRERYADVFVDEGYRLQGLGSALVRRLWSATAGPVFLLVQDSPVFRKVLGEPKRRDYYNTHLVWYWVCGETHERSD